MHVMDVWKIYSSYYDELNRLLPYTNMLKEVASMLDFNSSMDILDVGCGTGNLCEIIAEQSKDNNIVGIDASSEMLKIAREKLNEYSNVKLYQMDLDYILALENESFDSVTMINSLYAVKDCNFTIEQVSRVLRKGGKLIIVNPVVDNINIQVLKDHYKAVKMSAVESIKLVLKMLSIGMINFFILLRAKNTSFHFMSQIELEQLLNDKFEIRKMSSTYSNQSIIVQAVKR